MSAGSTQTDSSALKRQAHDDNGALAAFNRLKRKAVVVMIGLGLVFVGMSIAITDADQTLFQKFVGSLAFFLLIGLGIYAWYILKDANKWARVFRLRVRQTAQRIREQEAS